MIAPARLLLLTSLAALGACGRDNDSAAAARPAQDPIVVRALAAPLMTDPDLSSRNPIGDAIAGGGPALADMPAFLADEAAIAAATQEAERLAGGPIEPVGDGDEAPEPMLAGGVTLLQRAAAIGGPGQACGASASYAMAWSLRLPAALPIYPRGNLLDAAGSDSAGCALRVVRFVTPVDPARVLGFYRARARAAGFAPRLSRTGEVRRLSGSGRGAAFAIEVRRRSDGLSEIDLVVNGG